MKTRAIAACVAAAGLGLAGCQNQGWGVKRVDPAASTDLDYRFNDEDARQAFRDLSGEMLSRPWVDNWMREHAGQRPIVYLGNVRNDTQEYINSNLFTNQLQDELINSGRVRVKAERDARQQLRDERLDTKYNDPATIKAVAKELNADFALVGSIEDNKQRSPDGRTVVNYYQVRMELIDVETAEKVFGRTKEIKKVATR